MRPIFCAHLIIFLGLLNLDIITSTQLLERLHCLFVCNLQFKPIPFLYIQTLNTDCSPIEDVDRRRRSRAEFGLVSLSRNCLNKEKKTLPFRQRQKQNLKTISYVTTRKCNFLKCTFVCTGIGIA